MSEKFCLKWNDFHSNVTKSFSKLRIEDDFFDVTLVSDDQTQISAHKVVLSSCSEYFRNVLKKNKHPNPLLCLEGISSEELNNILDYAYVGEVQIYQNDLDRFLKIAERLKLEGLITDEDNAVGSDPKDNFKEEVAREVNEIASEEILNDIEDKTVIAHNKTKIIINSEEFSSVEELDAKILEHIEKDGNRWKCNICDKLMRMKVHAKEHVEIHFDGLTFPCPDCDSILRSRHALRSHIQRKHK